MYQSADAAKRLKYFSNNCTIIKYCISPKDKIRKWRDKLKLTYWLMNKPYFFFLLTQVTHKVEISEVHNSCAKCVLEEQTDGQILESLAVIYHVTRNNCFKVIKQSCDQ